MEKGVVLQGIVQKGHSRGKQLGFPTINFPLTQDVSEGVYFSRSTIGGKSYNGLTFIGAAKTFNETDVQAETYVLDFSSDVYGQMVTVSLLQKLRDNKKFASQEELVRQMHNDKKQAEEFFNSLNG